MSSNNFHVGNAAFRTVMGRLTPLCAPSTPFFRSCHIAGMRLPSDHSEAAAFSKKCINGLKKKADLLSKLSPSPLKRTHSLNLAANICFFPSWSSFQDFAEAFPKLSPGQRASSGDSFKLSMALWQTTPNRIDDFIITCLSGAGAILSDKLEMPLDDALEAVMRLYTDVDAGPKSDHIHEAEISKIISIKFNHPAQHHLMALLSHRPMKENTHHKWPDLSNITTGMLLRKHILANESRKPKFTLTGKDFLVGNVMAGIHTYAAANLSFFMNPMKGMSYAKDEERRLLTSLENEKTRSEASQFLDSLFKPIIGKTVLEAVTISENDQGFYSDLIPKTLSDAKNKYDNPILTSKSRLLGLNISTFAIEPFDILSNHGCRVYNICSIAHSPSGDVVGIIEIFYAINPSGKIKDLGMLADEIEVTECIELTLSMVDQIGLKTKVPLGHVVYITSWEVARPHRHRGLGKELMEAVFNVGISHLPPPDFVLARIHPSEYPVPLLDGTDPESVPNYGVAVNSVWRAWDSATKGGTVFGNQRAGFFPGKYCDSCHGHPDLRMGAMLFYQEE